MRYAFLAPLLAMVAAPAAAQSRDEAQLILAKHAISGAIVLVNGANNGAWSMVRPVTGVVSARDCTTDFAAPKSTQLVGVKDAANHMTVGWQEVSSVSEDSSGVRFVAPWVGAGNSAILRVASAPARAEVARALQALVKSCNPNATPPAGLPGSSPVPLAKPGQG